MEFELAGLLPRTADYDVVCRMWQAGKNGSQDTGARIQESERRAFALRRLLSAYCLLRS
jgi:hypothetical protein